MTRGACCPIYPNFGRNALMLAHTAANYSDKISKPRRWKLGSPIPARPATTLSTLFRRTHRRWEAPDEARGIDLVTLPASNKGGDGR